MMLNTASDFPLGTRLAVQARPASQKARVLMQGTAAVMGYRELIPDPLYGTRERFVDFDGQSAQLAGTRCARETAAVAATG